MPPREKNLGGCHAHSRPSQASVHEVGAAAGASTVVPEGGELLRTGDNSRRLVFDPPAELLMTLFGLYLEAVFAVPEVGWAFHEEVFDQEKLDDGEGSPACFGYPRLQEFYLISYNHPRAHAGV